MPRDKGRAGRGAPKKRRTAAAPAPQQKPRKKPSPDDPLIGRTLGKCRITGLLGEGKTSIVYEAEYEPLNRTVAVKVLQEHLKQMPAVLRVFQQEGRAVAALDHENVIKIYDVGEDDGHHYLVLEVLHGRELLERIQETQDDGGMDVEEVLGYLRQAAAGLHAAHRKNLVHRDIKPQNLVVEPNGTLKIVDFGLAAEAEGAFSGGRLGTPHYMAPEQCRGEAAGTASDIYALGITLFHMLVGHPPYAGRSTTEEIIEEHLKGKRLEPERLRSGLPRPVANLVRQMTRMDPNARPSARELQDLLTKLTPERLAAGPARRGRKGTARRAAASKSSPGPLIAIGGVVVLGIVGLVLAMGGDDEPAPQPKVHGANPDGSGTARPPEDEPDKPRPPDVKVEKTLAQQLDELMRMAKQEEKTGNHMEAHTLYSRVVRRAPAGSAYAREAAVGARAMRDLIDAERKGERRGITRKRIVSAQESEATGAEFDEKWAGEFKEQLGRFQVAEVKAALEKLHERTRDETAEQRRIERAQERLVYIERLLSLVEGRAGTLTGGKEEWRRYDEMNSADEIVMGADANGVKLKDLDAESERVLAWRQLPTGVLLPFLDALRNENNAEEALWLGYFCRLRGDQRASSYFDFVKMLDSSPEMRKEVKDLREG